MIDHFTRRFCFTLILYILHFGILGAGIFLEDTTTRIFFYHSHMARALRASMYHKLSLNVCAVLNFPRFYLSAGKP
jgi:hypothetical protein